MSTFFEDVMIILRAAVSQYGSIRKLAEAAHMNPSTISKWLAYDSNKKQRSPNIREIGIVMDMLGVRAISPQETDKALQSRPMSKEIEQLQIEKAALKLELEKEKAVSKRLQEMVQSMVVPKNNPPKTEHPSFDEDKTKTA